MGWNSDGTTFFWLEEDQATYNTPDSLATISVEATRDQQAKITGTVVIASSVPTGPSFLIGGTAELSRTGLITNESISDVSVSFSVRKIADVRLGVGLDGPFVAVMVGGVLQKFEIVDGDISSAVEQAIRSAYPDIPLDFGFTLLVEDFVNLMSEAQLAAIQEIFNTLDGGVLNRELYRAYLIAKEIHNWPLEGVAVPLDDPQFIEDLLCFLAGTPITLLDGTSIPIEQIAVGDTVLSYNTRGNLVAGHVVKTFQNSVTHVLDVHGLKVTPGHITLCGDGIFKGRHVPIVDILLSDGALVQADGTLIRIAINAPLGSILDAFVKVAVAPTSEDVKANTLIEAQMRVGTLLFDREGAPVSVLDCLQAEGYVFDPVTGLVAKLAEMPHPLFWFGRLPKPEDYILARSRETLEGILVDGEWEGSASALIDERLRQTRTARMN